MEEGRRTVERRNNSNLFLQQVAKEQTVTAVGSKSEVWNVRSRSSWDGLVKCVEVRQSKVSHKLILLYT